MERLAALIDQFLPYPGHLQKDWILWVELWLRTVRHPELRPTGVRLYGQMRAWLAEAIAAGIEDGAFDARADPGRVADRLMALADGFGVRVLIGDLDIDYARREVWAGLRTSSGFPRSRPAAPRRGAGRGGAGALLTPLARAATLSESRFNLLGGIDSMSPRPRLDHVRRPELLQAAAAVIRRRGLVNARRRRGRGGRDQPAVGPLLLVEVGAWNEALTSAEERFYEELEARIGGIESALERLAVIVDSGTGEGDYDAALWMELWAGALARPGAGCDARGARCAGAAPLPRSSATVRSAASSAQPTPNGSPS